MHSKLPDVKTSIFTIMSSLANKHGAINLSQGFPNFDCSDTLKALVAKYMAEGKNQYAPMPGVDLLRNSIALKVAKTTGAVIDPNKEITVTAGATQALFTTFAAFISPGDEVILVEPAYDCYAPSVIINGGRPIPYALRAPAYMIDWQEIGQLVTPKTRMIVINNPHNPSGQVLSNDDFQQLSIIVKGTDILILSDEVYEHIVFDGLTHQSVLHYPELYKRSILTFSFGKIFHNTGWKMGYVLGPPHLMKEFRKAHQFNVFSVNTPIQYALGEYLQDEDTYLSLSALFEERRNRFLELIEGSRFKPISCSGSYFMLLDYSTISDECDEAFAKKLTINHGVATIPVSVFYSNRLDEKVIRVCFAKTDDVLVKAGDILRKI